MTLKERFDAKWQENPETGCWEWTASRRSSGYGQIYVAGKLQSAHRVSYELHVGSIPESEGFHGTCVCHRCDNKKCVRPDHLFLGTTADNLRDMAEKGRRAKLKGEENARAKFTAGEASLIREAVERLPYGGVSFLARWFGVSQASISDIRRGRTWTHV